MNQDYGEKSKKKSTSNKKLGQETRYNRQDTSKRKKGTKNKKLLEEKKRKKKEWKGRREIQDTLETTSMGHKSEKLKICAMCERNQR